MRDALRVLIVDDSPDDAAIVLRELRRAGYQIEHLRVQTRQDMARALSEQSWDAVLCDYSMPEFDALQALALVRELPWSGPMLIVSGTIGEERAVECMRAGAHDLIMKDRPARLVPAIERELEAHARRVEQERTRAQLARAEDALIRSQKLQIIGQMTAGISHDLRNLLQPIALYADLIEGAVKQPDPEQAVECVGELRQVVQRGLELVNRLRDFMRPPSEVHGQLLQLDQVAHEALAVVRPRAASSESAFVLREELAAPPQVLGNVTDLVSALVNLLTNAIDSNARLVTVRTGASGNAVWVEVRDDGPGMSPALQARVFEPFFTTKGEHGTGLGLAMVHAAALRYDGWVDLDSAPGSGTRVRLSFPRVQATAARAGG